MANGYAALTAYLYPLLTVNKPSGEKREHRMLGSCDMPNSTYYKRVLPSSSSSEVMDLERMDKAVVGALFGGGGAGKTEHEYQVTKVQWP